MPQPTKSVAIANFLSASSTPEFSSLYNYGMEVQVNVAQDRGDRIEGEFKGKKWNGWTDGVSSWKSFRIPWDAKGNPNYTDSVMSWDLAQHVEAIGMTGWDWINKTSKWVAFDFDSI